MRSRAFVLFVFVGLASNGVASQPATAPPPALAGPSAEAPPTPAPTYAYEPESRRDPFVSLVSRGSDARPTAARGPRPEGLPGVLVEEVSVRGILRTKNGWIAMIGLPSGRTHTVRPGDRLMDGAVRSITAQAVVLTQEVNDPLSLEKQREVRKFLRGEVK
jgi:Tfp pilus assembly protein PilP